MLTRDIVREITLDGGWKAARRRDVPGFPSNDPWLYLTKEIRGHRIILHCHCLEGSVWIGAPEDDRLDPEGPVLDIHMSDPESIIKIQKYLRDRC